jgi:DNA-directed RNA polymerase specialized sigma24 family protein
MSLDAFSSVELLERWRAHADQEAAAALYDRYAHRLVGLARGRLPARLRRRLDPQDVVLSACRSFFVRIRDDTNFVVRPEGDLWDLLAAITMRKLFGQIDRHGAAKRSAAREAEPDLDGSICLRPAEGIAREPGPDEAAELHDELGHMLAGLRPGHRRMVELRLEGHTTAEIAAQAGKSDRLVRLVLAAFRDALQRRLGRGG